MMHHLLPSQYTRASTTAKGLLDLVERENEEKLHNTWDINTFGDWPKADFVRER